MILGAHITGRIAAHRYGPACVLVALLMVGAAGRLEFRTNRSARLDSDHADGSHEGDSHCLNTHFLRFSEPDHRVSAATLAAPSTQPYARRPVVTGAPEAAAVHAFADPPSDSGERIVVLQPAAITCPHLRASAPRGPPIS